MRLFIGIPYSERIRNQIRKEVARISSSLAKGKLSKWDGYHITLKFLGEVSEQNLADLALLMSDTRFVTEPFELEFTGLGHFRKSGGDVLWLGVTMPPQLLALQQEVEAMAQQAGFEPEARAFSPHLTLGRGVRYRVSYEETVKNWSLKRLRARVDRMILFQSTPVEGELAYVPLIIKLLEDPIDNDANQ